MRNEIRRAACRAGTIAALVNSAFQPANLAFQPRHSRESGNPDVCGYLLSNPQARLRVLPPPVIPAKAGIQMFSDTFYLIRRRDCASLSESGFSGFAGFSGFHFAQIAIFAITEISPKTNTDERLPVEYELVESCKSYNPENPDSDEIPAPASHWRLGANLVPHSSLFSLRPNLSSPPKPPRAGGYTIVV